MAGMIIWVSNYRCGIISHVHSSGNDEDITTFSAAQDLLLTSRPDLMRPLALFSAGSKASATGGD